MTWDIFIGSTLASTVLTIFVCLTFIFTPNLWLSEISEGKIKTKLNFINITTTVLIIAIILGSSFLMAWWIKYNYTSDFWVLFLGAYIIQVAINLVDLLIIDILIYMWIYPPFMQLEGVEPLHSYWYHTKGALKGISVIGIPFALLSAGVAAWLF